MTINKTKTIPEYSNNFSKLTPAFLKYSIAGAGFTIILQIFLFAATEITWIFILIMLSIIVQAFIMLLAAAMLVGASRQNRPLLHGENAPGREVDYAELTKLKSEKQYFASVLSHDLRSPLSSIVLLASYLKGREEEPESAKYFEMVEQSARRELEMITTLLLLMRPNLYQQSDSEPINIAEIVQKWSAEKAAALTDRNLAPLLNIPAGFSALSKEPVATVILTALLNHVLYLADRDQQLEISVSENAEGAVICLKFDSKELAAENLESLFTPDRLAVKDRRKEFPENIDLYFCRQILAPYNGTIDVYREESPGTFIFRLKF